jgi:citrate lyase subunit beta/citryl-CoA lyase
VAALETVFPNIADVAGLAAYPARGREDGFAGIFAIHSSQVEPILAAFRLSSSWGAPCFHVYELERLI